MSETYRVGIYPGPKWQPVPSSFKQITEDTESAGAGEVPRGWVVRGRPEQGTGPDSPGKACPLPRGLRLVW